MNTNDRILLTWLRMDGFEGNEVPLIPQELITQLFNPIPGGVVYWNEIIRVGMQLRTGSKLFTPLPDRINERLGEDEASVRRHGQTDYVRNVFNHQYSPFMRRQNNKTANGMNFAPRPEYVNFWSICWVVMTPHLAAERVRTRYVQQACEEHLLILADETNRPLPSSKEYAEVSSEVIRNHPVVFPPFDEGAWDKLYSEDRIRCHRQGS